ncbi:MAG: L-histidine N(alpha)-methyltransferase [Candidatus Micrarchaeales archaeon]|nr:L-histidine N(alpha)-methyltransferase [Candidatus Micrarchaeales archaeon]
MMRSTTATETIRSELLPLLREQKPELHGNQKVWHLARSDTWYQHPSQVNLYNAITSNHDYASDMCRAEERCFYDNKSDLRGLFPRRFYLVDLGPGDGKHTFKLMRAAGLTQRIGHYYPVDISEIELKKSSATASREGIPNVTAIKANFIEELSKVTDSVSLSRPALYNIGASFSNFDREFILALLSDGIPAGNYAYLSAQLLTGDAAKIEIQYAQEESTQIVIEVMKSFGFEKSDIVPEVEYNWPTREIWVSVVINRMPAEVAKLNGEFKNIEEGNRIVIMKSYKPKLFEFEQLAGRYFNGMVFTDKAATYAGFIGQPRKSP